MQLISKIILSEILMLCNFKSLVSSLFIFSVPSISLKTISESNILIFFFFFLLIFFSIEVQVATLRDTKKYLDNSL